MGLGTVKENPINGVAGPILVAPRQALGLEAERTKKALVTISAVFEV